MGCRLIEVVSEKNVEEVLPLIKQYQEFYQVSEISDSKNREFFSQFGADRSAGCQFLYRGYDENKDMAVGFASVYFTYASTIVEKVAVLNDLYTVRASRGKGVGRQLIEHCRAFAAQNGAARLQWVTAPDNEQAQKLYDALDTKKSTWCFYTYNT